MEATLFGEIQMTAFILSSIAAIGEYHVYTYIQIWEPSRPSHFEQLFGVSQYYQICSRQCFHLSLLLVNLYYTLTVVR